MSQMSGLFSAYQISSVVDLALHIREELIRRELSPGDVNVMVGCALGVLASGGIPGDPTAR